MNKNMVEFENVLLTYVRTIFMNKIWSRLKMY